MTTGSGQATDLLGNDAARGIVLIIGATVFVSTLDVTTKYLGQTYPVVMVVWARYFFHFVIYGIPALIRYGPVAFRTRRLALHLVRATLLAAMTGLFVLALTTIPLTEATAISFIYPVLVLLLSVVFLGERVGPWRWGSVAVGFLGVLVIVRPGVAAVDVGSLYALLMACFYALYQLTTRALNRTERPLTTLFYTALVGTVITSALVPWYWTPPETLLDGGVMVFMGVLGGVAHLLIIQALRFVSPTVVAPFFYVQLIFASLAGFLVFGDIPDSWTILGAVLIAAAGLVIWFREKRIMTE